MITIGTPLAETVMMVKERRSSLQPTMGQVIKMLSGMVSRWSTGMVFL